MNTRSDRIAGAFVIVLLLLSTCVQADPKLTHIYEKKLGPSHAWFYGNWKVSYEDKKLGTVTGLARVAGGGLGDVTVALRHPKTENVYYLRSKKVDVLPDYEQPDFIRIEFVGQSPPSGDDGTDDNPAMKDIRDLGHRLTVMKGGKLKVRYEDEETIAAEKEADISEGLWLTVELQIPKAGAPEELKGTWRYACSENQIKYNRCGARYDATTGQSSGEETWRRPEPIVTSATTDASRQMYVVFVGHDLPVQPGRTVNIACEESDVKFPGRYETDPKDDTKLYAQVRLDPDMKRWSKKVRLNGREAYCDFRRYYPILDEEKTMRMRKESDEKLAKMSTAYHEAYDSGDRAEAMRIKKEMDEYAVKTDRWFDATEKEKIAEEKEQAIRTKLGEEIRRKAARIAEPQLAEVMEGQDTKDAVTGKAEYVSIGAGMQEEMKKETRKSKRELVEAYARMAVIREKLDSHDPPPTEAERKILQQMWDTADLKRQAAEQYLSDADKIAAAGYVSDVVLTVSGGKIISIVGRRQLAKEAAKRTAAGTGRTAASETAGRIAGRSSSAADDVARQMSPTGPHGTQRLPASEVASQTPAKPPVDPGGTTILNRPAGRGVAVEGTERIAGKPPVDVGAKTILEKPVAKSGAAKPPVDPGVGTILEKPAARGAGASSVKTTGSKASSTAGSTEVSETALRTENMAAERALRERLSRTAAEAEKKFKKAAEEGIELSEAESARIVDAVIANNYNKSMNTLIQQARKVGVSEAEISKAVSHATDKLMPVKGSSVAIGELQRSIARASNHILLPDKGAAKVLQTIIRVQKGHAGKEEVKFLREAIAKSSRQGTDYFEQLSRTGTVDQYKDLSTTGYQTIANRSEIEALKKFARQNKLIE